MSPRSRVQEVAQQVLDAFQAGTVPQCLALVFLYKDLDVPSRKWSWRNQLLASLQGHYDARGFRQWLSVGRHVREGQRAFYILGPCTHTAKKDNPERGIKKGDTFLLGYRDVAVFGYSQTDGDPLPEHLEAERRLPALPLREVAESWGLKVVVEPTHLAGAAGIYRHGEAIKLAVANLATWTHELVHAADDRLGQLRSSSKLSREVVAELGGSILLDLIGYPDESDRGGAYRYITRHAQAEGRTAWEVSSELIERTCNCVDLILRTAQEISSLQPAA